MVSKGERAGSRVVAAGESLIRSTAVIENRWASTLRAPFESAARSVRAETLSGVAPLASWRTKVHRSIVAALDSGRDAVAGCVNETGLAAALSIEKELAAIEPLWPAELAGTAKAAGDVARGLIAGLVTAERREYAAVVRAPAVSWMIDDVRRQYTLARARHADDPDGFAAELADRLTAEIASLPGRTGSGTVWALHRRISTEITHRSVFAMNLLREETIRWVNDRAESLGVTP